MRKAAVAVVLATACSGASETPHADAGPCSGPAEDQPTGQVDYEAEMIAFVERLASYARCRDPDFGVFPQNGAGLGTDPEYVETVTGIGQEDVHYGYDADGVETPAGVTAELEANLDRFVAGGRVVLAVDYPFDDQHVPAYDAAEVERIADAHEASRARGYVPCVAVRDLDALVVPPGFEPEANDEPVTRFGDVANAAYRLQPAPGQDRAAYLAEQASRPFDLLVTDYSTDGSDGLRLSAAEVDAIRNGTGGLVIAYMSIGEAESYRFYWQEGWDADGDGKPDAGAPAWLADENPSWPGNYKVRYWDPSWQRLIFGAPSAYLDRILEAGFDGVYLDIIDAYECFEGGDCVP